MHRRTDAIFTFSAHSDEGYALAWSPASAGRMYWRL